MSLVMSFNCVSSTTTKIFWDWATRMEWGFICGAGSKKTKNVQDPNLGIKISDFCNQ